MKTTNAEEHGGARRVLAAGLTAAALFNSPALADADMAGRLDAVIDRWVSSERIVGLTAIVARDGEVIYHRNAGYADREAGRPITDDTIFRLASMTKAMTSATALALVEEGRLSLDDTVSAAGVASSIAAFGHPFVPPGSCRRGRVYYCSIPSPRPRRRGLRWWLAKVTRSERLSTF